MKAYYRNSYRANSNGFTLIEVIAAVIIVGIAGAIASPSVIGMFRRQQVKNAITIVNGAVKEAQRQAIRQSVSCDLIINTVTETITANPTNGGTAICLREVRELVNDGVNNDLLDVRTNIAIPAANTIRFSAKGNTISTGTVIVSSPQTLAQRCFAISVGLGMTRTGIWNPTNPTGGPADQIGFDGTCDPN